MTCCLRALKLKENFILQLESLILRENTRIFHAATFTFNYLQLDSLVLRENIIHAATSGGRAVSVIIGGQNVCWVTKKLAARFLPKKSEWMGGGTDLAKFYQNRNRIFLPKYKE